MRTTRTRLLGLRTRLGVALFVVVLAFFSLFVGCALSDGAGEYGTVRVAAIQFHSVMGDPAGNRTRLAALVEEAAANGARIVVLPEAAVPGYADLTRDVFWSDAAGPDFLDVAAVAETFPGPSAEFFSPIADRLDLYLTVPFIEREGKRFYNAVALLGPDGTVRALYRKQHPWPVADASWATAGPKRACVVDTEYGRLGLMICYDVHGVLPMLGEAGADIVLHPVAWFGPNSGNWFETVLARRVAKQKTSLILANWTFPENPGWSGHGHSLIIGPDGTVLSRASKGLGNEIVYASVPRGRPRE
ncbi:MAG: carbon-nitrogen hydrolase family protein [Planctomycetota bacterium]